MNRRIVFKYGNFKEETVKSKKVTNHSQSGLGTVSLRDTVQFGFKTDRGLIPSADWRPSSNTQSGNTNPSVVNRKHIVTNPDPDLTAFLKPRELRGGRVPSDLTSCFLKLTPNGKHLSPRIQILSPSQRKKAAGILNSVERKSRRPLILIDIDLSSHSPRQICCPPEVQGTGCGPSQAACLRCCSDD